jgi:2-phospho-L-lactate guanylyltransferase
MNLSPMLALVVARSFATGKSRIGGDAREGIARAMFERVVGVVSGAPSVGGVVVATDGVDVAAVAGRYGADVLFDQGKGTLAQIVDRGIEQIAERGARAAIVVMADLPMIEVREIERICVALVGAELVIAPDRELMGTNAIGIRLPAPIGTRFGNRDSFQRFLTASGKLSIAVVHEPGLAFDLDHPADLEEARRRMETTSRENEKRGSRVSAL